ncbi:hypothetical protein ASA1KI_06510 [Opitutales bacterium ASA1]|uniref:hypothetical protein n=1 Tax=Congregicoccus parvus TaxID=3081749 RepID=UPI002B308C9B|nr:hypothetical protein ASA1KI_06510 [Opitutales bacterium ASA1]
MRAAPLIALVCCATTATVHAAELRFRDGRHWSSARLLHVDPTYALVMHERGVYTVLAADLTEASAAVVGIREPTPEEVAARRDRPAVRTSTAPEESTDVVAKEALETDPAESSSPNEEAAQAELVHAFSTVLAPQESFPFVRLQGRVLARLARGAIVAADGMPPQATDGETGWVVGTIFIHEDRRLQGVLRGAPVTGRVLPAGEHAYTDSQGTRHVLAAWRFDD